jgi:hypothetical protein
VSGITAQGVAAGTETKADPVQTYTAESKTGKGVIVGA